MEQNNGLWMSIGNWIVNHPGLFAFICILTIIGIPILLLYLGARFLGDKIKKKKSKESEQPTIITCGQPAQDDMYKYEKIPMTKSETITYEYMLKPEYAKNIGISTYDLSSRED